MTNRILGNMLRCFLGSNVKTWEAIIPQAECAYDHSVNRTTRKTPYEASYGLMPQHVLELVPLSQEARVCDGGEAFAEHI